MLRFPAPVTRAAADALGWIGDIVGPVDFAGVRFLAVVDAEALAERPPSSQEPPSEQGRPWLTGALVEGPATPGLLRAASRLAAYAPRAVLVRERRGLTGFLVDAALLDQGVVVAGADGVTVLAPAGPVVPRGGVTAFDRELLRQVRRARGRRDGMLPVLAHSFIAAGSRNSRR
ncbi:MAG: hypothetical protein QG671_1640 [Actinomycetota bacterium]|nr:hypothetical protein [Actinomycetota bacterium]